MKSFSKKECKFNPIMTVEYDNKPHSHDYFEIFYVTHGDIVHNYDTKHEKLFVGDAYLICPHHVHCFTRKGPCAHRDIVIYPDLFKSACDFIAPDFYDELLKKKYVKFSMSTESIIFLEKCFSNFLKSGDTILRENYQKALTCTLASLIYFIPSATNESPSDFRDKCIDLINSNFTHPNALQIIRNLIGYNNVYFTRKFKKIFNCTPSSYITNLRLEHAVYLLSISNYTLEECCSAIGIYSVSYFINIFKEKYGMTPSKYIKELKDKKYSDSMNLNNITQNVP